MPPNLSNTWKFCQISRFLTEIEENNIRFETYQLTIRRLWLHCVHHLDYGMSSTQNSLGLICAWMKSYSQEYYWLIICTMKESLLLFCRTVVVEYWSNKRSAEMWFWSGMVVVCRYKPSHVQRRTENNETLQQICRWLYLRPAWHCAMCASIFCLKDCRRIGYVFVKLGLDKRIMHSCKTTFAGFGCSLTTMIRMSG